MPIGKITLQSTSVMSLNDRFTVLSPNTSNTGPHQTIQNASRKNQKLAEQMENRPAVMAALRTALSQGNKRGRGSRVGFLRGARGARGGVVKITSTVRGGRGGFSANIGRGGSVARGRGGAVSRGRGRGGLMRGRGRGRGSFTSQVTPRVISAESLRGRGAGRGMRGARGSSVRRGVSNGGVPSIKQRLAVQGRLSQPTRGAVGFRGRLSTAGMVRGGGSFRGRGVSQGGNRGRGGYPTRTFRGRGGRGGRGGRY